MVAPEKTPQPILDTLSAAIQDVVKSPEFRAKLSTVPDMHMIDASPEYMATMIKNDTDFWSRIIKSRNIKIEQ